MKRAPKLPPQATGRGCRGHSSCAVPAWLCGARSATAPLRSASPPAPRQLAARQGRGRLSKWHVNTGPARYTAHSSRGSISASGPISSRGCAPACRRAIHAIPRAAQAPSVGAALIAARARQGAPARAVGEHVELASIRGCPAGPGMSRGDVPRSSFFLECKLLSD